MNDGTCTDEIDACIPAHVQQDTLVVIVLLTLMTALLVICVLQSCNPCMNDGTCTDEIEWLQLHMYSRIHW